MSMKSNFEILFSIEPGVDVEVTVADS